MVKITMAQKLYKPSPATFGPILTANLLVATCHKESFAHKIAKYHVAKVTSNKMAHGKGR